LKQRLYYLDNLRTALTILVVIFHTSIAYGAAGSWILIDVDTNELTITSILLTLFTAICQAFFMGLFFFLSAYFVPSSYDRKGPALFLKDRFVRLGVPLVAYCFVIGPMTNWYAHLRDRMSLGEFYRAEVWSLKQIFVGPAWFLEASLYFAVGYAAYRWMNGRGAPARLKRGFPGMRTMTATAVAIGLVAYAVRFVYPAGQGPLGLQFGYFPSYILLFAAGIMAYRYQWLERLPAQTVKRWGWIAVCSIPVLPVGFILTGALEGNMTFEGGLNLQALLYALWEPFVCFGVILVLLRCFQSRVNKGSPLMKWMSAHAYTVYFIHPPVIVFWTIVFRGIHWQPAVKWVIVSALSVVMCFLVAALLRSIPGVKRVL
jgi:glucans biosynthesis protein C